MVESVFSESGVYFYLFILPTPHTLHPTPHFPTPHTPLKNIYA
ncbi:hypothetical protein MYAER_0299 [Microcystis aeruginosa NIES-2549]|uniref:Uncharacterized protein n=1 Tax=Microcystis aeruginosa NIES-2549 TaxID=1641812 RepID=A0A0F6U1Q6_MICAE|nr:hypothetical protein MYAER_0299 [Microcystis aeruginosa NIES-2549]AOC51049.1 hypothetical protein amyaer_0298 [Microcystis aeruginosa NIES-2481]